MSTVQQVGRGGVQALAVLAMLGLAVLAAPSPAHASLPGFKTVNNSQGWVDFNGDGQADWCMLAAGNKLSCTLSTGTGFGVTIVSGSVDPGYTAGRAWTDVNGDGRADYCRVVGGWNKNVQCTPSTGAGFGSSFGSGAIDPGWDAGRAWVDFTGDGRADYCRVIGSGPQQLRCTPSTGNGFGTDITTSTSIDPGWDAGRAWVDFTGDGRADYCRVIGSGPQQLRCTPSTGNGFGTTNITSSWQDAGYDAGRAWTDVNADAKADYCRVVGLSYNNLQCTLSAGGDFGQTFTSDNLDAGYNSGRFWVDVNGDGNDDYCREVGGPQVACAIISTGLQFADTWTHPLNPAGVTSTRAWPDFNNDHRADFCRVAGSNQLYCTVSTGSGFGQTFFGVIGA